MTVDYNFKNKTLFSHSVEAPSLLTCKGGKSTRMSSTGNTAEVTARFTLMNSTDKGAIGFLKLQLLSCYIEMWQMWHPKTILRLYPNTIFFLFLNQIWLFNTKI